MNTFVWFSELDNNQTLTLSCLKNFNTFNIKITSNLNDNFINNRINNNGLGVDFFLFNNQHNERILFEKTPNNLTIVDVIQAGYQLTSIEEFKQNNNFNNNILDNMTWLMILGRISLI